MSANRSAELSAEADKTTLMIRGLAAIHPNNYTDETLHGLMDAVWDLYDSLRRETNIRMWGTP